MAANSSSEEFGKKVKKLVLVKSNDIYTLRRLDSQQQNEKLEVINNEVKDENVSVTSKVSGPSGTTSCTPQASSNTQLPFTKKADTERQVVSKKQACVPNILCKKKFSTLDPETAKKIFPNLSSVNSVEGETVAENTSENVSAFIDITEESVMELLNKNYGDMLEAQIPYFQNNKVTEDKAEDNSCADTIPKTPEKNSEIGNAKVSILPSDIYGCNLGDEKFVSQDANTQIEEAKRILETIVIEDSPEKLFTTDELKRLPDKIFESPPHIKLEIHSPKKENADDINNKDLNEPQENSNIDNIFEYLKIKTENEGETKCEKKIWELEQKDVNFGILIDDHKTMEPLEKIKEIVIADEDVNILQAMDEFIEEINKENKVLKHDTSDNETNDNNKENLVPNGCLEVATVQNKVGGIYATDVPEISLTTEEHKLVLKAHDTFDRTTPKSPEEQNKEIVTNKNLTQPSVETKKNDVLEVIVRETRLQECANLTQPSVETKKNDVLEVIVRETGLQECANPIEPETTKDLPAESEDLRKTQVGNIVTVQVLEESSSNAPKIHDQVEINYAEFSCSASEETVDIQTNGQQYNNVCHSTFSEEINSSDCQILIIKEDGFLEPLNSNDTAPTIDLTESDGNVENAVQNVSSNKESKRLNDEFNKKNIMTLLNKAKNFQFAVGTEEGDQTEKEKLKALNISLKERAQILRRLYERLEHLIESTREELDENLEEEEMCALKEKLDFVKGIMEKTFLKEEKKLKYKVVSVTKKGTDQVETENRVNKRVAKRPVKGPNNKLLQKAMFRMKQLMAALDRNSMMLNKTRKNVFVSKLKEVAKNELVKKKMYKKTEASVRRAGFEKSTVGDGDHSETTIRREDQVRANDEKDEVISINSETSVSDRENLILEISDNSCKSNVGNILETTETEEENINVDTSDKLVKESEEGNEGPPDLGPPATTDHSGILETVIINDPFDQSTPEKSETEPTMPILPLAIEMNTEVEKCNVDHTKAKVSQNRKKSFKAKTQGSQGYFLRPRVTRNNDLKPCKSEESCKATRPKRQTGKALPYEVNYSKVLPLVKKERKFDYDLRNDDKPCVVLYPVSKPIFQRAFDEFQKKNFEGVVKADNTNKKGRQNRYDMRSRTEKMVLRSRKL